MKPLTSEKIYKKLSEIQSSGGCGIHVFDDPKIIYIHLSKCAGTTIHKALTSKLKEVPRQEVNLQEIANNFDEYFSFTVVRNTYSKVLSEYNHEVNSNLHTMDFDEWLESVCNRKRIDGRVGCFADYSNKYNELDQKPFCVIEGQPYLSYIGRFKNLNDVFDRLREKAGGKITFAKLNPTSYNKIKMTSNQIQLIEERFREDIEYFGFKNDLI